MYLCAITAAIHNTLLFIESVFIFSSFAGRNNTTYYTHFELKGIKYFVLIYIVYPQTEWPHCNGLKHGT